MTGVHRFEDLITWQVAAELRDVVIEMTSHGPSAKDFKFRDQIRDSASSAPRNTAEGFALFNQTEFHRFLTIAKGSLVETQNHLRDGRQRGYFSEEDYTRAWRLSCRALRANSRLRKYLRSCPRKRRGARGKTFEPSSIP
jgi:four helix bundle protein